MTFRTARTRVAVAVAACLLGVAPSAPSAAVGPEWVQAPCAKGEATQYAGSLGDRGQRIATVVGSVQPCEEPVESARFGFMRYLSRGAMLYHTTPGTLGLTPYGPADATTPFTIDYNLDSRNAQLAEWQYGPLRALCVVRAYTAPLVCVAVDRPAGGGAPHLTPIPVDDRRVASIPVVPPVTGTDDTGGTCGNCV